MAEVTPNLGLKKPLESEFVSIQTLNENMDKVDQSLGPVDDLPTTAKNAAGAISEIYDQLADKPHEQLTLTPGVQIVQGGDVPAILRPTMQGRTLVNLLGRTGNGEDSSKWSTSGTSASISIDTSNKVYGLSSLKITAMGVTAGASNTIPVVSGKHYLAISEIKNGTLPNSTSMAVFFGGRGNAMPQTDKFAISYIIHSPSSDGNIVYWAAHVPGEATSGQYFNADGMRVFEITAAEKSYINSLTTVQAQAYIAINYPHVDDMKHVNAVYIENKGKNLLPPFSEWTLHPDAVINEAYKLTFNATLNEQINYIFLTLKPNTDYTVSANHNAKIGVYSNGSVPLAAYTSSQSISFNSGTFSGVALYFSSASIGAGTYTLENPILNVGSDPLLFEPQRPSYLYLPDCNLRSNVDGSVADRLFTDGQGKPRVTRRFREIVLDGTLAWAFNLDFAGFKRVICPLPGATYVNAKAVKYDGKPLRGNVAVDGIDDFQIDITPSLYITIADKDSGWGESYTPTADEIKAYFMGWVMYYYESGGSNVPANPYTGVGTKGWAYRVPSGQYTGGTNVMPTSPIPNYTPYRLMYQLAQSIDEPVTYEGSLMLHEGRNQVEVGTGIVVREFGFTPYLSGGYYYINAINGGAFDVTKLRNRTKKILDLFQNGYEMKAWNLSTLLAYGDERIAIAEANYNKAHAYSVTYLALDTYTIGVAPQAISAEYVPNIRESVESLVREVVETRTETSVLQNTKVQKQQSQWIALTLLSEWTNRYGTAGYYKDDSNIVHFKGFLQNGTAVQGTVLFYLPKGYRPSQLTPISTLTYSTNSDAAPFAISIDTNGSVTLAFAANSFVALDGISFRAEQ